MPWGLLEEGLGQRSLKIRGFRGAAPCRSGSVSMLSGCTDDWSLTLKHGTTVLKVKCGLLVSIHFQDSRSLSVFEAA